MEAIWEFAELESVYAKYRPLTPYGRASKERRELFDSAEKLAAEYDAVETALAFIKKSPSCADKAEFHLKNIPLIEVERGPRPDLSEIFLYKKMLYHIGGLAGTMPQEMRRMCGLHWRSEKLLERLQLGGGGETFYLADSYLPRLKKIRLGLRALDRALEAECKRQCAVLKARFGLDFSDRQFLLLPDRKAAALKHGGLLFMERYDSERMLAKPVLSEKQLALSAEHEKLVRSEKEAERTVLTLLAARLREEKAALAGYAAAIERLDTVLAKARLAQSLGLKRPHFASPGSALKIRAGRLLPLQWALEEKRLGYTPLSFDFAGGSVSVISGSNMGGKTVVLKTVAQLQLLAQCGFFVPAEDFRTICFSGLHYVGYGAQAQAGGLSSFGQELHSFMSAYARKDRPALFLLDEFARTTNADEASALLSAIVRAFVQDRETYAFLSTHFSDLKAGPGVCFYRMRGLDSPALRKTRSAYGGDLPSLLKAINRHMRYELRRDSGTTKIYDALKVAVMLGFDRDITARALKFMEEKNEN